MNNKKTYFPESQKRYNKKIKTYAIKYTLHELDDADKLDELIAYSGLTANAYIKKIIADHLKKHFTD